MRLDIVQKGSKYTFYKKGVEEPMYKGRYRSFFFKSGYTEVFNPAGEVAASVRIGNSIWFPGLNRTSKATYIIDFTEQSTIIEITVKNYSKGYWEFEYQNHQYAFYRHRGHKRSLFKNEKQVARYDKRAVNLFENDRAYVVANSDEDELLLLCLFLAYDMGEYNDADISLDFGQVLEGVKKIDHDWQPWK
ncbi:hypothetical protein ACFSC6_07300 [Rufibacter sediminis]|uniref:Uncharacterized protein n=1 Tax=Rufibacter sediminis TaxID=2762756 RepID=A0ABR6VQ86_9BACT|nr:hypothetical protein [Rufibacter sediminis]MBC3539049.1 hypothetical protein [Rufibacter sediminis]